MGQKTLIPSHPTFPELNVDFQKNPSLAFVDNSYILMALRFGWVGAAILSALFLTAIFTLVSMRRTSATYLSSIGPATVSAFAAMMLGMAVEIGTVFWAYDYAFWLLFHIGIIAGTGSQIKQVARG